METKKSQELKKTDQNLMNGYQTKVTEEQMAKVLNVLATNFQNISFTKDSLTVYYECLKDLNYEQLKKAVIVFCKAHEQIYPGTNIIAILRKYALGHFEKETSAQAWEKVLYLARRGGGYLENEVAKKVVKYMGGWHEIGLSENSAIDRAHFIRMYNEEMDRENFMQRIEN